MRLRTENADPTILGCRLIWTMKMHSNEISIYKFIIVWTNNFVIQNIGSANPASHRRLREIMFIAINS